MSESDKDMFANLFGDIVSPKPKDEEKKTETAIEVSEMKESETPSVDDTETKQNETKNKEDKDDGVDPKDLEKAKEELGIGGAAFCDELFSVCPDVFPRLKEAGKTLHGLFEFAYSYALDEYVKKNGKHNGGGYWNLAELAEKYLDPNIKEGYTVKEPKVKTMKNAEIEKIKKKAEENAKKTEVEKIAKKAAKAAKKAAKKTEKDADIKSSNSDKNEKKNDSMSDLDIIKMTLAKLKK